MAVHALRGEKAIINLNQTQLLLLQPALTQLLP